MSKRKHARFAENLTFPHLFQLTFGQQQLGFQWKGKWSAFFGNQNPIVLELGCGKGEYTVNLAIRNPEKNFIGIDIKGARLWKGCKTSLEMKLPNVAFVRTHVQVLDQYFGQGEVSEIWITFPDPQPQHSREKKRLTAPRFLSLYNHLLLKTSMIHLKTDNMGLFDYTLDIINQQQHEILYKTYDLYQTPDAPEAATSIQTFYEQMFLAENKPIGYLCFRLKF